MSAPAAADHDARFGPARERTLTWHDPLAVARAGLELPGLEYLQKLVDGELPGAPIAQHFNMRAVAVREGEVTFVATPDESAYNPIGLVHGGMACTLLDSAAGCAVHTTLPAGTGYASIEIKVNYLRPIHGDAGELTCRGWVTKPGRRVAFAQAELRDAQDRLLADCSTSCAITSAA